MHERASNLFDQEKKTIRVLSQAMYERLGMTGILKIAF